MKKLLLSALAVCAFTFSNAQEETKEVTAEGFAKGDIMVSGAVGYSSESTDKVKESTFKIAPRAAYFLSDNIAAGIKVGYTTTKNEDGSPFDTTANMVSVGVFGRYYMTPASKFSGFAELGADYNSYNTEVANVDSDASGFGVGFAPGISYFVSKCIAIEATWGMLSYNTFDNGGNGAKSTDSFELGLDTDDLTIGMVFKF